MAEFVKLSSLIDSEFTVESVGGPVYKYWDPSQNKMLVSDTWQKGYRKLYPVITDKGQLDLGSGQIGNLLEAVFINGKANLIGVTFAVKSNGKQGMDIRYFFNAMKQKPVNPAPDIGYILDDEPLPEQEPMW